ncbi:MAG: cation:proton antiporter [Candidatus Nanohaloarchaea archaeon]
MEIISTLTLIFLTASAVLLLFHRFDHPAIPAYIIAGIIVGGITGLEPFITQELLNGAIPEITLVEDQLLNLAQLGIAFLVFTFGLKFDPQRLRQEASVSLDTTAAQIFVIGAIAYFTGLQLGFTSMESAIFSTAAALSSSLVGLQLADREIQNDLLHGRISESIHLIQDLIGLALITVLFASTVSSSLHALGAATSVIILALLIREYGFDFVADQSNYSTELMMLAGLTSLIGMIALTSYLGLPMVIGSFAAGLTAAKFPHNMELLDTLGSLKDFFSAIFFVALGALISIPDPKTILSAFLLVLLTSMLKPFVTYKSLVFEGLDPRTSMLSALSLDQVSEIALIVAIQAFLTEMISGQVFNSVIIAATFSMLTSSYTKRHEEWIYQKLKPDREVGEKVNLEDHVIVVGYHVQGIRVVDSLLEENARVAVIDNDPEKVSTVEERGIPGVYGDIMDKETWQEANFTEAKLVVSTVPSFRVSKKIMELEEPEDKIVRAENMEEASILLNQGAVHVIVPDLASSEILIDHIEGIIHNENYREELRRKSLLELREYLETQ